MKTPQRTQVMRIIQSELSTSIAQRKPGFGGSWIDAQITRKNNLRDRFINEGKVEPAKAEEMAQDITGATDQNIHEWNQRYPHRADKVLQQEDAPQQDAAIPSSQPAQSGEQKQQLPQEEDVLRPTVRQRRHERGENDDEEISGLGQQPGDRSGGASGSGNFRGGAQAGVLGAIGHGVGTFLDDIF